MDNTFCVTLPNGGLVLLDLDKRLRIGDYKWQLINFAQLKRILPFSEATD
jgi:hypothetical protein